jgi:hypothetical protein
MIVKGTYQGIPLIDWEFSLRGGWEPSRGWCRCFLSDLGGTIPKNASISSLLEQFDKKDKKREQADNDSTFNSDPHTKPGKTVVGTETGPSPGGRAKLSGPWGDLILEAEKTSDSDPKSTKIKLSNIFWIEAVTEAVDSGARDAIVRIELADERILWGLGGYVFGDRNKILNDMEDVFRGNLFEWEASVQNPAKVNDISDFQAGRESARPVLDRSTIKHFKTPYTLFDLVVHCLQKLPGPPKTGGFSQKTTKIAPPNVSWGPGSLAKDAGRDLLDKYNMVIAPTYNDTFDVYERGEEAFGAAPGAAGLGQLEIHNPGEVPSDSIPEGQLFRDSATLDLRPLSVEIIGDRIVEEVACPSWLMVMRSDGTAEDRGLSRAGEWVDAIDLLDAWGYSLSAATFSLMANYDTLDSRAFEDCPPQGDDEASKELRNKRKRILRQHLYKSFMVTGPMRRFLPMMKKRAEPLTRGKLPPKMGFTRDAQFYSDAWVPDPNREIDKASLFGNIPLAPVSEEDVASLDRKDGVVTFKNVMGSLTLRSNFAFRDPGLLGGIFEISRLFSVNADALMGQIEQHIDSAIENFVDSGKRGWFSDRGFVRRALQEFMRQNAKWLIELTPEELEVDPKTLKAIVSKIAPHVVSSIPLGDSGFKNNAELHNISECTLIEPRIVGIWGWEKNWGRADDYYRFRSGKHPEQPAFPIKVEGLRQYVSIDGTTNKDALDRIAEISANEYLAKNERPLSGTTMTIVGFHKVLVSGQVPEVTFKGSIESPDATTEFVFNRFQHGIAGRPPAYATWTVFQKPIRR